MTKELILQGAEAIYEAAFIYEQTFCKVDILHRAEDGWELYEVKSSTGSKDVYLGRQAELTLKGSDPDPLDKVTRFAQLVQTCRIVSEPGFVKCPFHVARKRHWTGRRDVRAQPRDQVVAELLELVGRFGQDVARHG